MTITQAEGKKKKPPTFHYLPKNQAKRLKKSWVDDRKIRGKWKAQKRREGLIKQTSEPKNDIADHEHEHEEANADSASDTSLPCLDKATPSHDKPSLRDLRKIAYAPNPPNRQNPGRPHPKGVPAHSHTGRGENVTHRREKVQPDMKLRMNVLLEKIKRDLS